MRINASSSSSLSLDRHLWRACAGKTVKIPAEGSAVYYFPQGHAENANCSAEFAAAVLGLPPIVLCRVESVRLSADSESDEVFAAITLRPVGNEGFTGENGDSGEDDELGDGVSFAKVLTQSDANNGGGFSVPRHCADSVFPPLNYAADPPVQELQARDVHGEVWKFRHIYRGTPRRHLLTSGWSVFVNRKRLVARDSIVFVRNETSGEIFVGMRRSRRTAAARGSRAEEFAEAAARAARGEAFEVLYYPRCGDGAAEFCVGASAVRTAMADPWRHGVRLKMAVEDEATSRVKTCNGTAIAVKVLDPVHWPNSPWRILQVSWDDEQDKQQNPDCVSPWMIEAVPSLPICPPFPTNEQPRKKIRSDHFEDFLFRSPFAAHTEAILSNNTLDPINHMGYLCNTNPVGIQGARQFLLEVPIPEFFSGDRVQKESYEYPYKTPPLDKASSDPTSVVTGQSCGDGTSPNLDLAEDAQKHGISLFGKVLCAKTRSEQDMFGSGVRDNSVVDDGSGLKIGCCKVFKEFINLGWNIDLLVLGSYEELYKSLSKEFEIELSEMSTRVLYHDATGAPKLTGDRPFGEFVNIAKRLTIIADPEKDNDNKRNEWRDSSIAEFKKVVEV